MALWVNDKASQYLILVLAKRDVPRIISVLSKKKSAKFQGLGKTNNSITLIYSQKFTDFRDPWCMKRFKVVYFESEEYFTYLSEKNCSLLKKYVFLTDDCTSKWLM